MPANKNRKYQRVVHYIEDIVGADVNRDLLKVALESDDINGLAVKLESVSGQPQSAVDVADQIDKIQNILSGQTLTVTDDGAFSIATWNAGELGVDIQTQTESPLVITDDGALSIANWNAGELGVDIQTQTASPLTITDDGALSIANWNAGVLSIQEDSPLDVSASTVTIQENNPIDASASALTIGTWNAGELGVDIQTQTASPLTITDDGALSIANWNAGVLSVQEDSPLDVSASTVTIQENNPIDASASPLTIGTWNAGNLTVTDDGSFGISGTVATEQQSPVKVEDSNGTNIDPSQSTDYPDNQTTGHDLIGTGDLTIGPVSVAKAEGVVISANSTDGNTFSVSVSWEDSNGNIFQAESASDLEMASITQDWSRLVRKGPQVKVTFTDTSGGSSNNINAHVDAQR